MDIKLGVGFLSTLTLIFVVAKLWGVIDWSWFIVFLPVLLGLGVGILILLFIIIMIIIGAVAS